MAHEHSFANPAPAALAALAVACFGFGAAFLDKVGLGGMPLLAAWLVGGGIVQLSAALIELKDHNITGGNVFLFFAAFFMFAAALSQFAKFMLLSNNMEPLSYVEGCCWIAGAIFLTLVMPAYFKSPSPATMGVLVALVVIALWTIAFLDLGIADPKVWKPVAAYLLIAAGGIALYMSGAITCNTVYGKTVFPIPGPFIK